MTLPFSPQLPVLPAELSTAIDDGLTALGVERLVLAIHDQSFPSRPDEDIGRGSPYGQGARDLLAFIGGLGFGAIQLGPQGDTSLVNPSPYDGALFTKNPMSLALGTLAASDGWAPLTAGLLPAAIASGEDHTPDRVNYARAWRLSRELLTTLHQRFCAARPPLLDTAFADFRARYEDILGPDCEFAALAAEHGTDDWHFWPAIDVGSVDQTLRCPPAGYEGAARSRRASLRTTRAFEIERHLFGQFVLDQQHRALRAAAASVGRRGIALFGDLQIGFSARDVWSRRDLFRRDYVMGAPPSRTNPDGQPWGYPVLDPQKYFERDTPGPVMRLLTDRVSRLLDDFDGLRLDHPHGLVCPWVYRADDPDPAAAVARGARLFCSPNLPEHPALAALAIPRPAQLSHDPRTARYADEWVQDLDDDQVTRYGVLFDAIIERARAKGRHESDVVCEVLSTWPYPLRRVMERHGLGRFCVTQKADLARDDDVYRSENATERDWIMVGNHDTKPIWLLADAWHGTAAGQARAEHLARRLMPNAALRPRLVAWLVADGRHLCQGMFAELFASRARRVSVFFADLFGAKSVYNVPGEVNDDNWMLRLPPDFVAQYQQHVQQSAAFNVPLALALAVAARRTTMPGAAVLGTRLLQAARLLTPSLDSSIVSLLEAALAD